MTTCRLCREDRPDHDFYKSDRRSCKECIKASVRRNRAANLEYYREYDRARSSRPHRVSARKSYPLTERGRIKSSAAKRAWDERHPDKKRASVAVGNAIRDGRLEKEPCFVCGAEAEAHHAAYDLPLHVTWLCDAHHKQVHKEHREREREVA